MLKEIIIENVYDFDTAHIFDCGQCFRWNNDIGVVGTYVCKASYDAEKHLLKLETNGGAEEFWRNYFDLNTDYSDIRRTLAASDPNIIPALEYGRGIRILNQDIFETIISFIVSQNNNIPRIKKCIEAICARYGEQLGEYFGEMRYSFPSAEVLAEADVCDLAELKLGYRCEYIVSAARQYLKNGAPASYDDLISYLGIGPKVANCIMLFGLHKADAFPIDTWVKHIMNDMYGFEINDVKGMSEFAGDRFGSYAGYAQQYLFFFYREKKG